MKRKCSSNKRDSDKQLLQVCNRDPVSIKENYSPTTRFLILALKLRKQPRFYYTLLKTNLYKKYI